jgi:hypothetical protein
MTHYPCAKWSMVVTGPVVSEMDRFMITSPACGYVMIQACISRRGCWGRRWGRPFRVDHPRVDGRALAPQRAAHANGNEYFFYKGSLTKLQKKL